MPKRSSSADPVSKYLSEIQRNLSSGIPREQTHRRALEDLLESLDITIDAFNDPKHIDVGAPDFTIRRKGHATCSAAGCTAAWMVRYGIAQPGQTVHIQQGVEIKRHSQIFVRAAKQADKINDVRVGGHAVEILEGEFSL